MAFTQGMTMTRVTIEEARERLDELIEKAGRGEEVVLFAEERPVARLTAVSGEKRTARRGSAKGLITAMAEDFDAPLDDFRAYME